MKRERKIYGPAFKTKAVQLSNERTNISELARELGMLKHFQERSMKYGFIKNHEYLFPIEKMCRCLEVGLSGYYK